MPHNFDSTPLSPIYFFADYKFQPDARLLINTRHDRQQELSIKHADFLHALVKREGEVVSYEDLKREVWKTAFVEMDTIQETKRQLNLKLGGEFVENARKRGYRLAVPVRVQTAITLEPHLAEAETIELVDAAKIESRVSPLTDFVEREQQEVEDEPRKAEVVSSFLVVNSSPTSKSYQFSDKSISSFSIQPNRGLTISCAVAYAALYVVALFVEVAYEIEIYGRAAMLAAPLVFGWIFLTAYFGFFVAEKSASADDRLRGLLYTLAIFIGAAIVLYLALGFVLPSHSVTRLNMQAQPAHAAYLKNAAYFLAILLPCCVVPFRCAHVLTDEAYRRGNEREILHLLSGRRRAVAPGSALYLTPRGYGGLLLAIVVVMTPLTLNLFDNLKPAPQMNLFVQLVLWRTLLMLALAAQGFIWYSININRLRRILSVRQIANR